MKTDELLLHWRWPITAIIALGVIAIETIEHRPVNLRDLDFDLVSEVLLFGVAFPLIVGLLLNALVRLRVEGIHPMPAPIFNHEEKGINIPRVLLVVENELMFGAAVERLLAAEAWLNVEDVTPPNQSSLIETIKQLKPNVIILEQASLLTTPLKMLTNLLNYPELRVVTMSASDNQIQISDKQQLVITQLTDLVKVIHISQSPTS